MSQTIGRKYPRKYARGDTECICFDCGVHWHRSDLRRGGDGQLHCPDEGSGMDQVEAAESDAQAIADRMDRRGQSEAGNCSSTIDLAVQPPITVFI